MYEWATFRRRHNQGVSRGRGRGTVSVHLGSEHKSVPPLCSFRLSFVTCEVEYCHVGITPMPTYAYKAEVVLLCCEISVRAGQRSTRGGLVFNAHRLLYHSIGLECNKEEQDEVRCRRAAVQRISHALASQGRILALNFEVKVLQAVPPSLGSGCCQQVYRPKEALLWMVQVAKVWLRVQGVLIERTGSLPRR